MTNIVTAAFETGSTSAITDALYQWDYGQVLRLEGVDLPDTYEVHFANCPGGLSKTVLGNADGAPILDEYLTTGKPVYAWVYVHIGDSDGETVYMVTIPVIPRARPTDQPATPQQQTAISQALNLLNHEIEGIENAAEHAAQATAAAEAAANSAADAEATLSDKLDVLSFAAQIMTPYGWPFVRVGVRDGVGAAQVTTAEFDTESHSIPAPLRDFILFGLCAQDGTPTPSAPAPIAMAGSGGTIAVGYAGHMSQVPTPGGLAAVRVTTGGNTTDFLGNQYAADAIDWTAGKYIKRVAYVRLIPDIISESGYIRIPASNSIAGPDVGYALLCTHYATTSVTSYGSAPDNSIRYATAGGYLYIKDTVHGVDIATAQQFFADNQIYAAYVLADPIITDLTEAQVDALNALRSPDGVNTFTSGDALMPQFFAEYFLSLQALRSDA